MISPLQSLSRWVTLLFLPLCVAWPVMAETSEDVPVLQIPLVNDFFIPDLSEFVSEDLLEDGVISWNIEIEDTDVVFLNDMALMPRALGQTTAELKLFDNSGDQSFQIASYPFQIQVVSQQADVTLSDFSPSGPVRITERSVQWQVTVSNTDETPTAASLDASICEIGSPSDQTISLKKAGTCRVEVSVSGVSEQFEFPIRDVPLELSFAGQLIDLSTGEFSVTVSAEDGDTKSLGAFESNQDVALLVTGRGEPPQNLVDFASGPSFPDECSLGTGDQSCALYWGDWDLQMLPAEQTLVIEYGSGQEQSVTLQLVADASPVTISREVETDQVIDEPAGLGFGLRCSNGQCER